MSEIRILLADDHVLLREGTRKLLEQEKDMVVVGEANDGEEAVKMAEQLQPEVALVDIAMPKLNGIEATKQIKAVCPSAAVLILSAYDNDQYVFAVLEAGAAGYLLKNVRGTELVEAIRAVHEGEAVLHPAIARKVLDRFTAPFAKPSADALGEHLSERETEVLRLAARGLSNREIADRLVLSTRTVQAHLRSIFSKMGVGSRTEAVVQGLRKGWFILEEMP